MRIIITTIVLALAALSACSNDSTPENIKENILSSDTGNHSGNPLLSEWETPFGVPPFDLIESEHYLPALREGMQKQDVEIAAIVKNPDRRGRATRRAVRPQSSRNFDYGVLIGRSTR